MSQPEAKRRKGGRDQDVLSRLLFLGGVSNQGLLKIVRELQQQNLDVSNLSKRIGRAAAEPFERLKVTEQMPLQEQSRSASSSSSSAASFTWEFAEPNLLLQHLTTQPGMRDMFRRACREHPPSRANMWQLVITFDEYTPGNKLRLQNERKCMVLNYSFLELGAALSSKISWITPVVLRSSIISKVQGGWSHFLRRYLQVHLCSATGITTAGVPLQLHDDEPPILLYAKLTSILSDGDGLRAALDWKGSAGLKPCFKHWNVWKKDSDMCSRRAGHVEITCPDTTQFLKQSQSDVAEAVDMLAATQRGITEGRIPKRRLEEMQTLFGINHNPHGLLAARDLRAYVDVVSACTYDWMHAALQDGFFSVETHLLLTSCQKVGVTFERVEAFLKQSKWQYPQAARQKSKALHRIFSEHREDSCAAAQKLKCSASELLGVYALIRFFVVTEVPHHPSVKQQLESFFAACRVIDLIVAAKNGFIDSAKAASDLRAAQQDHLARHLLIYGTEWVKPKHHFMLDIPEQITQFNAVLDCFVTERCHLKVKPIAENVLNTSCFERSVLEGVICTHHRDAADPEFCVNGLRGQTAAMDGIMVADKLEYFGLHLHVGDMLRRQDAFGTCVACLLDDKLYALVDVHRVVSAISPNSARCSRPIQRAVWALANVSTVAAWCDDGDERVVLW